jgi:hypothetical protein
VTEPVLWVTDEPVADAGPLFARLLADHRRCGLWPLLLTMLAVPQFSGLRADLVEVISRSNPPGRPWHTGELAPVPGESSTLAGSSHCGARLCSLGFDTLGVSVAWPPAQPEHARRVAAEHLAFCADIAGFRPSTTMRATWPGHRPGRSGGTELPPSDRLGANPRRGCFS